MTINNLFNDKDLAEFLASHKKGDIYYEKMITEIELHPQKMQHPETEEMMTLVITSVAD